jgi:hypothetical protein
MVMNQGMTIMAMVSLMMGSRKVMVDQSLMVKIKAGARIWTLIQLWVKPLNLLGRPVVEELLEGLIESLIWVALPLSMWKLEL